MTNSSADFSLIADKYDESRNIPSNLLEKGYSRLEENGNFTNGMKVLDAGCGTGQVSLPLIERGYKITGVDISKAMLDVAKLKAGGKSNVNFVVSDVTELPFKDNTFDAVIVSKLFQHVSNWEQAIDELRRVTNNNGYIVHIQDIGAFRNKVRKQLENLADLNGYTNRYYGATNQEVHDYLTSFSNYNLINTEDLSWEKRITFGQALNEIKDKLFAEFWVLPDEVYNAFILSLENWIGKFPNGQDTQELLRCKLKIHTYKIK